MGVLTVVGLLGYGLISKGDGGVGIGSPAPVEQLTALGTQRPAELTDYRGRWVLLNVWASWCGPCKQESPALQRFSAKNRGKLTVVGVDTLDASEDGLGFVREFGLRYPQWHDGDGSYADSLGATGYPESFLVNPSGILVAHFPGPFRDAASITAFAQPALAVRQ
jgi:thiol-disulfide isomerase/thioredoxin